MASTTASKRTYHVVVSNAKGKTIEERDMSRKSQWSAHTAARAIFRDLPAGSKMEVRQGAKVLERWTMTKEGYEFEVLNGATVAEATRNSAVPQQRSGKAPAGKATKKARR